MNIFNYSKSIHTAKLTFAVGLISLSSNTFAYDRIVSATGNASETIAAMGLSDKLVAVDTTSTLPKSIMEKKPKIGYRRGLSAEGVISMQPDLLILAPDAGPATVVKQIKSTGVNTITIKNEKSINGVIADIEQIAKKLKSEELAKPIIDRIRKDETAIKALVKAYPRKPKMVFLMGVDANRLMALGKGTAGDAMIGIAGGENLFASQFNSVKAVSNEAMTAVDMDIIVIASRDTDNPVAEKIIKVEGDYGNLALTKAAKKGCIFRIGIMESLGFGPGVAAAAKEIADQVKDCVTD